MAQRGATLTEYAMLIGLVVVVAIGAIGRLQSESGSYLVKTGSDVGTPRPLAADINPDLAAAPPWLTQPPAPTTTTTIATTTTVAPTTTLAATTTTLAATTTTTAAVTTTSTTLATTTTTVTYPTGAVINSGAMASDNQTNRCFVVSNPGQVGSSTDRVTCSGAGSQVVAAVGTNSQVALHFTNNTDKSLCLAANNTTVVMATCNGSTSQLYTRTVNNGLVFFASKLNNLCITERSTGLELEACNNGARQGFRFG